MRRLLAIGFLLFSASALATPPTRTSGVQFTPASSTPIVSGDQGVWVDTSNVLHYDTGAATTDVVLSTRAINTTSGQLTGGGSLSGDLTLSLATAGTAGTYTQVVTDAYGRVVSGSSPAITLQSAYNAGSSGPQVVTEDSTRKGVIFQQWTSGAQTVFGLRNDGGGTWWDVRLNGGGGADSQIGDTTSRLGVNQAPSNYGLGVTRSFIASGNSASSILTLTGDANPGGGVANTLQPSLWMKPVTINYQGGAGVPSHYNAYFEAPTVQMADASVHMTRAATLAVSGPAILGTNGTIDNLYAIYSAAGLNRFEGSLELGGNLTLATGGTFTVGANTLVSGDKLQVSQLSLSGQTTGDVLYFDGSQWNRLAPSSTAGYVLTSNGSAAAPSYQSVSGGAGAVTGTGVANYLPIWTSTTAIGSSPLQYSGGVFTLDNGTSYTIKVAAAPSGTRGRDITITSGDGASGGHDGGDLYLSTGAKSGSGGPRGYSEIFLGQDANTGRIELSSAAQGLSGQTDVKVEGHLFSGTGLYFDSTSLGAGASMHVAFATGLLSAGTGGHTLLLIAEQGGAASSSVVGGAGGTVYVGGTLGGNGSASKASGAGGAVDVEGGEPGTDGGAGRGTVGTVAIGTNSAQTSSLTLGSASVATTFNGGISVASGKTLVFGSNTLVSSDLLQGGQLASGSVANAALANSSLTVSPGTGMTGGGSVNLGGSTTLGLANTAVTAGTYTLATLTVDATGRLTAASSGSGGTVSGLTTNTIPKASSATALTNSTITDNGTIATATGQFKVTGGWVLKRTATATDYSALSTDTYIAVTDATANRTITLPAANSVPAGFTLVVADESSTGFANGTASLTVKTSGTDTMGGSGGFQTVLSQQGIRVTCTSDGTSVWNISHELGGPKGNIAFVASGGTSGVIPKWQSAVGGLLSSSIQDNGGGIDRASSGVLTLGGSTGTDLVLDASNTTIGTLKGTTSGAIAVEFDQPVNTSGSPTLLKLSPGAHTTLAASTEATDVLLGLNRTVQWAAGTLATERFVYVRKPTVSFASASTCTTCTTLEIEGAPVQGTNATLTHSFALNIAGGAIGLAGSAGTTGQFLTSQGDNATPTWTTPSSGVTGSGTTNMVTVWTSSSAIGNPGTSSTFTQTAATSGNPTGLTYNGGAHTGQTNPSEVIDVNFNLARTITWNGNGTTVSTQRSVVFQPPTFTISGIGTETFTQAATVAITGSPVAGTRVSISNGYALWVQGGKTELDGNLTVLSDDTNITIANVSGGDHSFNVFQGGTGTAVFQVNANGNANTGKQAVVINQIASGAGSRTPCVLTLNAAASNLTQTGTDEVIDYNFNSARTLTWSAGTGRTITNNRTVLFQAPTLAGSVSSFTVTNAATVAITGAPASSGSMTLTNAYALWVQGGKTELDGGLTVTGAATTLASLKQATATKTTTYTLSATADHTIFADTTGGAWTLTLPTPAAGLEFVLVDSKGNFGTANLTLARHASEQINGSAASATLTVNKGIYYVTTDGTNWFVSVGSTALSVVPLHAPWFLDVPVAAWLLYRRRKRRRVETQPGRRAA